MDNQETNQTTGRFHIGQEIYVMTSVSHDRNYVYPILASVASKEAKLFFKKLTVTEHHKVTNGYSEEKEYDGYLLTDGETIFTNQYPVASYGQVSDDANYLFTAGLYNKSDEELRYTEQAREDWLFGERSFNFSEDSMIDKASVETIICEMEKLANNAGRHGRLAYHSDIGGRQLFSMAIKRSPTIMTVIELTIANR